MAISSQSPSRSPMALARPAFTITPPWPAMLSATSLISCMPTLPPQAYCMLREVSSQNG